MFNAPLDIGSNHLTLAPGDALPIPAGTWFVTVDGVAVLQYLDPVTGIWRGFESARNQLQYIKSDGFTTRIANLTGCPIAAIVTGGGSTYVQASTTVVASAGGSTWQPIVGGSVSVISVGAAGAGYGVTPLVIIQNPPPVSANGIGGVPATAYATLSAGTVSGVTLTNVGAGYASVPTAVILPNPTDPNIAAGITQATVVLGLTNAGKITAALCTNNGASSSAVTAPTLTPAGAGSGATISAVMLSTLASASVSAGGFGYGTNAELIVIGGAPSATPAFTNPAIELNLYRPRPAFAALTVVAGSITAVGTIYDSGLFAGTPLAGILTQGAPTSTSASVLLTLGTANATVLLQPAP